MRSVRQSFSLAILVVVVFTAAIPVEAQTWQNGGDGLWSNAANWNPSPPTSGTPATFDAAGNTNVNLGGVSRDLASLYFNYGAQAYTFTGNAGDILNFSPGGLIYVYGGVLGAETINSAIGLNGGAFTITNEDPTNSLALGGGLSLVSGTSDLLTVNGAGNTTINGAIASGAITGLAKAGAGTLTLGAANLYSGPVSITEGTISMTTANALGSSTSTLLMGNTTTPPTTVSTVNIGESQTFRSLNVATDSASSNTISIASGKTLTLTGSAQSNVLAVGAPVNRSSRLAVTGAGTLTITDASRHIVVALQGGVSGSAQPAVLDMSGLATFNATVANIFVSRPTTTAGAATTGAVMGDSMLLADVNNITVGTNIVIGGTSSSGSSAATMLLGTTNNIGAGQWVLGAGRPGGTLQFRTGLTSPTAALYGAAGTASRTNITLGDPMNVTGVASSTGGSSGPTGTMDFTGGTLTAMIGNLNLGTGGASIASSTFGSSNGVFTFSGAGSNVNVNAVVLGGNRSDTATATAKVVGNGTLNVGGGTFVVNTAFTIANDIDATSSGGRQNVTGTFNLSGGTATIGSIGTPVNLTLGNQGGTTATSILTPTLNVTGGSLTVYGNIRRGTLTAGTINSTVTLNGGTLDLTGNSIGAGGALIANLNFQAGTLSNVAEINNGAGLTKTTGGTLNLTGTNNFTGPVTVSAGTLNFQPSATHDLGAGAITLADSATLGVQAFNTSSSVLATTGLLTLGSASGGTLNFTLAGNPTVPLMSVGTFITGGANTINLAATAGITSGTYTLIDYTGILGGAGFGGLTLGSMPLRSSGTLADNAGNSSVDINVTADSIRWNGNVDNVWDINTTANWKEIVSTASTTYLEPTLPGEPVRFDDNAAGNFTVNVSTAVNPVSVTFDNTTKNYTLSGTGNLTTPSLVKNGAGTATISTSGAMAISTIVLNGSGAVAIDRADNPTLSSTLAGTGTLQKAGTNTLTMNGNSAGFTGTVDVANGTLALGSANALGNGTTNVGGSGTLELNGQTLIVGTGGIAALTGPGNVTATTSGTLQLAAGGAVSSTPVVGNATVRAAAGGGAATMSGGSNTYSGPTQLVSGTLALSGGNNRLPTATTVAFNNPDNAAGAAATLDLGATNQTISALTFPTGQGYVARAMTLTVTGTGVLTLNGPSNLTVGAGGVASLSSTNGNHQVLDMAGLNGFTFNNPAQSIVAGLTVGSPASATATSNVATINFAANNSITALNVSIATGSGASGGGQTTIRLGQTNVWNVADIYVSSSRADADVFFNTGLTNPTITLRGLDGTSAVNYFRLGQVNDTTSRTWTDTFDVSAGSIDALVTTMVIGNAEPSNAGRGGRVDGFFTMGAGSFTVGDLTIGAFRATAAGNGTDNTMRGNGTFTLNNAVGTLNATTIRLADVPTEVAPTGTRTTTGTLAILDGLVKATTITRGSQVGVLSGGVTATTRVDFSSGTIQNADGANLAIDDVEMRLLSDTGTPTIHVSGTNTAAMNAGTVVSDVGSLTKAGPGTLTMAGDNTYFGTTSIIGGTLALTATGQIAYSASIANNATFLVIDGAHTVNAITGTGTTWVAGASTLTAPSIAQDALTIGGVAPVASAVPEPGALALLLLAGAALLGACLRRK
ncbi:MAG: autotransporter-associated beta strand repeat-containing protein [Pirellulales bacterium]|nr:autotransporter-associated beta strand repeat-containing protein [Pirellulales bacterium]